ncbi:MAG: cell division protein SepF [Clostridia bacterium]|nr:cell division protein SepF [Clostridia bacterium]
MGLIDKIKGIMTIPDEEEFDEEYDETASDYEKGAQETPSKKESSPKIIKSKNAPVQGRTSMQVVIVKPERFDDVKAIADHLNEGKTVILNLEIANHEESRRIVDFLSGVAYANSGNMRKVAASTFIIVARNVDVMGELMLDEFDDTKMYL